MLDDSNLAFLVVEALSKKTYFSAVGCVDYADGSPEYELKTVTDSLGFTTIGDELTTHVLNNIDKVCGCYLSLQFRFRHRGDINRNFVT